MRPLQHRTARPAPAGLLLLTLMIAGCGTTLPPERVAAGSAGGDGTGLALPDVVASGVAQPEADELQSAMQQDGSAAAGGPAHRRMQEPGGEARGGGPAGSPGAIGTVRPTVQIGLLYNEGADKAAAAIGVSGVSFGDQRALLQTVVADLNRRAGIAGRRVTPVYVSQDAADTRTPAAQAQATCASFTEDARVSVVVSITGFDPALPACLARRGVPLVSRVGVGTSAYYQRLGPAFYTLADPPLDIGVVAAASALHERGFFSAAARTAVLHYDDADEDAAADALVAALSRRGVEVKQRHAVSRASSSYGAESVLALKADAITHVLFVMPGGGAFGFMTAAESQGFRPRYGLSSFDRPDAIANAAPSEQLKSAWVEGWQPLVDVGFAHQPPNAVTRRCLELHARAGTTFSNSSGAGFAAAACDVLWFIRAALEGSSGEVSVSALSRGAAGLGTSYASALTHRTRFTSTRRYGPALLRDAAFDESCKCFRYSARAREL